MRIAVLLSLPSTEAGRTRHADQDARALAMACALTGPDDVLALHASAEAADLEPYLGLGVRHVTHLSLASAADDPAYALAEACAALAPDLVLTGMRAETWPASGMTPYFVAQRLGFVLAPSIVELAQTPDGLVCLQALPAGRRRRLRAAGGLVATISSAAAAAPLFAYGKAREAKIIRAVGVSAPDALRAHATERPQRKAPPRLHGAVVSGDVQQKFDAIFDRRDRNGEIISPGGAAEAAEAIINRLRMEGVLTQEK